MQKSIRNAFYPTVFDLEQKYGLKYVRGQRLEKRRNRERAFRSHDINNSLGGNDAEPFQIFA